MRPVLFRALACSALMLPVGAQGPVVPKPRTPPPSSSERPRDTQQLITVEGCISGTRLTYDAHNPVNTAARLLKAREFVLDGPKELMRRIKAEHEGHEDRVTGIVIIPPSQKADTLTTTRRVGKTTVSAGTRQETKDRDDIEPDANRPLRLKVQELRHVDDSCSPVPNGDTRD